MVWTEDQSKAIAARGCNLLVSAAAGSGKTAVLVERIIGLLLEDGIDIDRLLVVTFTQAAAAEMRSRISRTLVDALGQENGQEARLRRQLNLLNRASISTIHAFCTEVVRSHFHLINIDPRFRIADAGESELLRLESVEELMEAEYEKATPEFLGLVERFGSSRSDQALQDILLQTHTFIQSQPRPLEWLREKINTFDLQQTDWEKTNLLAILKRQIRLQLQAARDRFSEALAISRLPGGPLSYSEAIEYDMAQVDGLLGKINDDLAVIYATVEETSHLKLKPINRDADPEMGRTAKELRDEGKGLLQEIRTGMIFKSPEAIRSETDEIFPYLQYLYGMTADFSRLYQEKKADKGLLDFNDLEHFTLEILDHPGVREEYQERYTYIFVDEYQDSNLVQESIINAIKREDNLFLVGDVKQSIYRFRLADPTLFLDKQLTYQSTDSARDRRIDLKTNYRSRAEILHGVNYLFRNIMSPDLGELAYDELAELKPGIESPEMENSHLELYLIEKKNEVSAEEEDELPPDHIQVEAEWVGNRIEKLLGQEIWDAKNGCYRFPEYRDIVILLRATRRWAPVFAETLMSRGIPVYADTGTGYFASVEVSVFLNLLRLIDNRCQDVPLLSIMRSPLAGFTLDDMIAVRLEDRDLAFYQALELYIINHDDELSARLSSFSQRLADWKEESRWMPVDEFLWKLLIDTDYYYYTGAMPGGEQRQANLRILVDRARQFEDTSLRGLFQFLRFVERLQIGSGDLGMAKILGENDNVVRIMSIHKSKGLEFPVVILAGLGQQFNLADSKEAMLFHRDLGLGPRYINPETRTITDTVARAILRHKNRLESLSEEMRILYVAMTRAETRLIIFGTCADLPKRCRKWCQTPGPLTLAQARHGLDWLGPFVIRHPDGQILRDMAEATDCLELQEDSSHWLVQVLDNQVPLATGEGNSEKRQQFKMILKGETALHDSPEADIIKALLDWQYPYRAAEVIPSKMSVTQITVLQQESGENGGWSLPALKRKPAFLEEKRPISAAEKGNVLHIVMQHIDIRLATDLGSIESAIAEMVSREIIRPEEAALAETEKILSFFQSPLGQRVIKSSGYYRERPFNMLLPAKDVLPGAIDNDESLIVQGVIDLYFEEADGLVLVDYKTNYIAPAGGDEAHSRENVIARYRPQLILYRQALESILGVPVKEACLYLFSTGEAVLID